MGEELTTRSREPRPRTGRPDVVARRDLGR
jgi:hypothetical protein